MNGCIDWTRVRERAAKEPWAKRFVERTAAEVDAWIAQYDDSADRKAGWYHAYVCERCSARLTLDLRRPGEHHCPACGHMNRGEKLDEAWNNMYRGRANAGVLASALLHRLHPDERSMDYIRRVITFYATEYDRFDNEAVAKVFEGKIMNQHLDDAVAMMTILLGMTFVRDELDDAELAFAYEKLFAREADLFDFFAFRIYNIPLWIKCAEAMIGVFFGAQELIDRGFGGRYGVLDQLDRGVTGEGLWYEGSIHYHFYALQPLLYLLFACRTLGFAGAQVEQLHETVERMLVYPTTIVFRNGRLPNPHDSHPTITLDRYAEQYEYASALYDNPLFPRVCATINRLAANDGDAARDGARGGARDGDTTDRGDAAPASIPRLLFDGAAGSKPLDSLGSVNHPDSCTAMVRSDNTELFVKYGIHTTLHAHPDAITFELAFDNEVVSYDLGSGGYASFLFAEWQRLTPSHNTVTTDMGNTRALYEGIVEACDAEAGLLHVRAKGVYDAVNYARRFRVGDLEVEDRFEIDSRGEHTYDWFFYCAGEVRYGFETIPVASLGTENGYQHLFDVRRLVTDDEWSVDFVLADKTVCVEMAGAPATEVHIVNSYTHSTEHKRYGLMVRRRAECTVYETRYRCIRS